MDVFPIIFAVLLLSFGLILDLASLYFGVCNVAYKADKPSGVILIPFVCYCAGIIQLRDFLTTPQLVLAVVGALIVHAIFQYPLIYLVSSLLQGHRGARDERGGGSQHSLPDSDGRDVNE